MNLGSTTPLRATTIASLTFTVVLGGLQYLTGSWPFGWSCAPRLRANESAAISSLRSIASAQAACVADVAVDRDGDGLGEYATLAELAGSDDAPGRISSGYRNVVGPGYVSRSGYLFGASVPENTDRAERGWCGWAWPIHTGTSGTRAFFVNQSGTILETANEELPFGGIESPPVGCFEAPYDLENQVLDAEFVDVEGRSWVPVR